MERYEESLEWRDDPVSEKQIDYIVGLGGSARTARRMTKGEASDYIYRLTGENKPAITDRRRMTAGEAVAHINRLIGDDEPVRKTDSVPFEGGTCALFVVFFIALIIFLIWG